MNNSENTEQVNNDEFVANVLEVITIEDDDEKECAVTMEEECAVYTTIDDTNSLKSETAAAEDQQNSAKSNKDEEKKRSCRLCHGSDEDEDSKLGGIDQEWVRPCKCSGTLKWVHRGCFTAWHDRASYQQRTQCSLCSYFYRFSPRLKPRWYTKLDYGHWLELLLFVLFTFMISFYPTAAAILRFYGFSIYIYPPMIGCLIGIASEKEYRLQLQLLREHKLQVMLENTGHYTAAAPNQSVFEESIQNSI